MEDVYYIQRLAEKHQFRLADLQSFGKKVTDYYTLERLDPSYRVYWPQGFTDVPAGYGSLKSLFESIEPGSAKKLDKYLEEAAHKYRIGIQNLVYKPGQSVTEFLDWEVVKNVFKLDVFTSIKKHIASHFKNEKLHLQFQDFIIKAVSGFCEFMVKELKI